MNQVAPLSHPHVTDSVSGVEDHEMERKVQELWNEWLKRYFTGQPFDVTAPGGSVTQKTFDPVALHWGLADPGEDLVLPIIHGLIVARLDGQPRRIAEDSQEIIGLWTMNFLIRCPRQFAALNGVTGEAAVDHAERLNRRVADQCAWLLRSPQVQALAMKGIQHVRVLSGPLRVAAGAWHLRQITVSAEVRWNEVVDEP